MDILSNGDGYGDRHMNMAWINMHIQSQQCIESRNSAVCIAYLEGSRDIYLYMKANVPSKRKRKLHHVIMFFSILTTRSFQS